MELSRFLVATSHLATQEILNILWGLKTHYSIQKSPLLAPILRQINPIHITLSYLSITHFYIIVLFMYRLS
jgi:hypothetical protein